jgi:uncharacterized membrane protein YbhN (UPF0104 family)
MQIPEKKYQPAIAKISFWSIIKSIVGLLLIFFVVSKASLSELTALATQVSWSWLGLTFVLFLLLSMLKAWQYHTLFDTDFLYSQILSVVILQNAISNFVASSAGIATYLTVLRAEQGIKVSRSASVFIITKVGDLIAIWLGLIISLFFVWNRVETIHNLALFVVVLIGAGLAVFGTTVLLRRKFVDILRGILERTALLKFRLVQHLLELADMLADFEQKDVIRIMVTASGLSCIYLIITFAWTYSSFHTFNLPVTAWVIVFVSSMLQLISIIPIQVFGGLGVSEAASLYFFGLFGFSQGQLATVLIGIRLLFYLTNLAVLLYLPLHALFLNRSIKNVK